MFEKLVARSLAELPWVMLGLRASANLDTGISPSMLVTGQQPALPGQLVIQKASIDDAPACLVVHRDKIQPSLVPKYTGSFKTLRRCVRGQTASVL